MNCRVKATAGYHPSEVCFGTITEENIENKIARLRAQFTDHASELVAVGECGIDVHYEGESYIELQKKLFRAQCEIAKELHLPIVIHSRDDFISTFDVLRDFKDEKIYFHCYGYGAEEIKLLKEYFLNLRI